MRWLPLVGWVLLLFGVSSIPDLSVPGNEAPGLDKIFHFGEYAVLGALFGRAVRVSGAKRALWIGALLGLTVGTLDELYQNTVPGRELDAFDGAADTLGAMLGVLAWSVYARRKQERMSS